jgi:glyoxylase I family protein
MNAGIFCSSQTAVGANGRLRLAPLRKKRGCLHLDNPRKKPPPPMLEISGVHHVALIVSNLECSRHFYTQVLGFKVIAENYRSEKASWKVDLRVSEDLCLELFSFPAPPPRPSHPEACGLRHIAFRVTDLDSAVAYMRSHSVPVEAIRLDEFTGRRFTFCSDPDGLPLELYEC